MSKVEVDQVDPQSGTTLTLGTSGDTVSIPSGVTLANAGTVTGIPTSALTGTIALNQMATGTDGNIISYDASGNPVAVATGSAGQVLTSAGAGAPPTFAAAGGGYVYKIDNQINTTRSVLSASSSKTTLISGTFTNTVASSKVLVQLKMPNYGTASGSMGIGFTYNGTDYDGAITQSQEDTDETSFSMMNKGFTNPASTGSINWVIYFKTANGSSARPFKTLNPNSTDSSRLPQQETQITFTEYTA